MSYPAAGVAEELPAGMVAWAEVVPGPELSGALAQVDPSTLNGHDLVELAAAYVRMISQLQAGVGIGAGSGTAHAGRGCRRGAGAHR